MKDHLGSQCLTMCAFVQSLTSWKLVWSLDLDTTACAAVLSAIIHCDNSATCNEQLGPRVRAEAKGLS